MSVGGWEGVCLCVLVIMDNTQLENSDLHAVWEAGRKEATMRNGRERERDKRQERASVLP